MEQLRLNVEIEPAFYVLKLKNVSNRPLISCTGVFLRCLACEVKNFVCEVREATWNKLGINIEIVPSFYISKLKNELIRSQRNTVKQTEG